MNDENVLDERIEHKYPGGIFIDACRIVYAKDASKGKSKSDFGIRLTLEVGLHDKKIMYVNGQYERDNSKKIISWSDYNPVKMFLTRLLGEVSLGSDYNIPQKYFRRLIGKNFWRLKYISEISQGEPTFKTFYRVIPLQEDPNKLYHEFEKYQSYIKNYRPQLWDDCSCALRPGATFKRFPNDKYLTEEEHLEIEKKI